LGLEIRRGPTEKAVQLVRAAHTSRAGYTVIAKKTSRTR
jgi:3,4-dihydroxy-2-butanone 4-phosphate synthase